MERKVGNRRVRAKERRRREDSPVIERSKDAVTINEAQARSAKLRRSEGFKTTCVAQQRTNAAKLNEAIQQGEETEDVLAIAQRCETKRTTRAQKLAKRAW